MNSDKKTILLEKLSKFQDKLLDLSKRNKMINSNFQSRAKTHFRIIDEIPDFLYDKLSKDNMEFKPLPPLDENPKDENTLEFKARIAIKEKEDEEYIKEMEKIETEQVDKLNEARERALRKLKDKVRIELKLPPISTKHTPIEEHCKKQGLNPDYDLPKPGPKSENEPKWKDNKIQTLMLPDTLNQYISSIDKKYRSTLRERGINILHFCFGFLEWRESLNSNQKLYAPILTFQVFLDQNKKYVNGISSELKINDALKEKLKREFNFILPELKENNNGSHFFINEYFVKVKKEITKSNHKWELKNWASFGLYNTQNMCIHKDIEDIKQDIVSHCENSKLEKILLGQKITESEVNEEYNVDNEEYRQELPALVESADASQYSAVLDVLKEKDIVIKGPPGTGKSQTITNIISTLISNGKKILFVAQKQAALDVVRNKLQANGLGNYILEVFSAKANKKMIMESMKSRFNSRNIESDISEQLNQKINRLWKTKEELNKYAEFMSKKFKNTGFTIHEIIWNHKPIKSIKSFEINSVETLSKDSIEDNIRSLHNIKILYPPNLPSLKESPFLKIKKLPHIHDDLHSIEQKISSFYEKTQSLLKEKEDIFKKNSSLKNIDKIVLNHPLVKEWIALNREKEQNKKYLDSFKVAFNISSEELIFYLKSEEEYIRTAKTNTEDKKYISSFCKLENLPDLSLIKKASFALEKEHISYIFSEEWQKAKQIFKNVYIGQGNPISLQEIKIVLNNEKEIFPENGDNTLINNIIGSVDSEELKDYVKSKEEYIRTAKTNTEDKKYISSFCKLENLPDLSLIKKASFALEKEHISYIFSEEWQKAKQIFKNVYIGQGNPISLQEIKIVLNNEKEIFPENGDNTLINNIVSSADSEELKDYVKSKEEYIRTAKTNTEDKKYISSFCKLENLPDLSLIKKASFALEKEHISYIFSEEWQKAKQIFKNIYIGQGNPISLQEIKIVLNNEKEIFPENGDNTLINNIIGSADSEELKDYVKSKEEYIRTAKTNTEDKKYISSFCKLENLPDLSLIKKASFALEKEHISYIFSEEWQKAKQIFKNIYIGQGNPISLQEIKIVLNNEKEIFPENGDNTLINNIIGSADSEELKDYVKSKEEYIRTAKTNTEDKKYISSFCKLENLPDLSLIKKASFALEKEHISYIFSEEWQKAKQIFKNVYIGQVDPISLQEIKIVLNNEKEIFPENGDSTLINNIIGSADSEGLKDYVKSKEKYIKFSKMNVEHKKCITSVCKLESLPELPLIEKAAQTLKKSNILSIFLSEYRKAQKIFTQIYIGKRGLYSTHNILTQLCDYLKTRPTKEQKESEYKNQTEDSYKKLQNIISNVKQNNSAKDILNKLYQYLERRPTNKQKESKYKKQTEDSYKKLQNIISNVKQNNSAKDILNKLYQYLESRPTKEQKESEYKNQTEDSYKKLQNIISTVKQNNSAKDILNKLYQYLESRPTKEQKESEYKNQTEDSYKKLQNIISTVKQNNSAKDILNKLYQYLESRPTNKQKESKYKKQTEDSYKKLQNIISTVKQNNSAKDILNKLYQYLESRPSNEQRESEHKKQTDEFHRNLCDRAKINNLNSILKTVRNDIILRMIEDSKSLSSEFKEGWLNSPDSLIQHNNFLAEEKNIVDKCKKLFHSLEIEIDFIFKDNKCKIKSLNNFMKQIKSSALTLRQYREILDSYNRMDTQVKSFYEQFVESGVDIQDIAKIYRNSVYKSQIKYIERKFREYFDDYTSRQLKTLGTDLKRLDKEVSKLYKKQIIHKIHNLSKQAPQGDNPTGRVKDKTEMELVRHIAGRENPKISFRDYFNRAFHTITWLKPCTLMSPLSVSEILPLANAKYDVMIIDEASQMKPEFSIPGIIRAKQIVIVGDQKQLPPTDFFRSFSEEEDDEDEAEESILDMALTVLSSKTLLWHYRSKHEDLIKFSNSKFYNDELIIPIASDKNNKGIKSVYIENGVYISRTSGRTGGFNDSEAKKIVSETIKFMQERPNESLGVATINKAQKDHIDDLFNIEKDKGNPVINKYIKNWSQKDEGLNEFFIKNLENIQGDERDTIFISTVYGPDAASGQVFQRFGPITGKYGHRRLNVLFTRAKNQIVLFTSLKPSNIQVHENKSYGIRILHEYLSFAKTGILSLEGKEESREIESPFQQWAIDQINSFPGFSAEWEIGVKGYHIDIGVKHEEYSGGYIMAVETDGASYHSIKSARDRDKLRQEILESYGWTFHRIWSTDWLRDPIKVRKDLKIALENRMKELSAHKNLLS